jgi:ABC-type lipoprotein release transport system permease subunit
MGFGWVHGLGFASALQDLHLPRSRLVPTLLGFNVGVEIGQLLAVLAAAVLIKILTTVAPAARQRSGAPAAVASALLLAAGLAWFLTRAAAVAVE